MSAERPPEQNAGPGRRGPGPAPRPGGPDRCGDTSGNPGGRPRRPRRSRIGIALPVAVLLASVGGCGPPSPPAPPVPGAGPHLFAAGYHAWWTGDAWSAYPLEALDRLYLFEVELDVTGGIRDTHGWPERWQALRDRARDAGLSLVPVVTLHPEEAVPVLLADPLAVRRAAASITALVASDPTLDGVHLDLEVFQPVPSAARDGYVALARALRHRLDEIRPGAVLSVFIPALDGADAYDEVSLAEVADYMVVQGYDLHHGNDVRAGPLAALRGWGSLNWTAVTDRLTGLGIPPGRLVMGVPLYGYEWPVEGPEPGSPTRGPGVAVPLTAPPDVLPELPRAEDRIASHGLRRDPVSDVPYYVFRTDDGWVQGWVEDARSLADKLDFVRARGLGGVAWFPLAYAPAEVRRELLRRGRGPGS
ncbi:MAG TPA: glycoside hydrolase family 18 protein [Longimicrobiales bacterium]|nr:glycoside hydrolase family 18 protein [Longimicrobiales bacterium]